MIQMRLMVIRPVSYTHLDVYKRQVPEETEIREGAPEYTGRLCVIGSKLKEDKLAELFGLA